MKVAFICGFHFGPMGCWVAVVTETTTSSVWYVERRWLTGPQAGSTETLRGCEMLGDALRHALTLP